MKKLFLSIMTASMFFVSCSNDETVVPENNGSENNVEDLVEIKLGAGSRIGSSVTESRAVEEVEKWTNGMEVGVFALDNKGPWNDSETKDALRNVLWHNVVGKLENVDNTGFVADINTTAQGVDKYYPRNDTTKNYTFYGYYPYAQPANYSTNKDSVYVNGTFTGKEDIMWGMTTRLEKGWNAKYARNEGQGSKPNLVFKHLMSWLVVNVEKGTDYDTEVKACTIDTLYVNHPENYKLTVATNTYNLTDSIVPRIEWTGEEKPLYVYQNPKNGTEDGFVANSPTEEVDQIFVKPGNSLTFYLKFKGESSENSIPLTLGEKGIEAGKKYNVNIKINGPKAVEITATLTPWSDGGNIGGEI